MLKILDVFTGKERGFEVMDNDLMEVLKMIAISRSNHYNGPISLVNNGIDNNSNKWIWNIKVVLTNNQWRSLLLECKNKKYKLIIKNDPDKMCFTKIKES